MHILMLTEVFFPVVGGSGKFVYTTAKNLIRRGHKVSVVTRKLKKTVSPENIEGINIYRISWSNNFLIALFSFYNINRFIRKFLKNNQPDLIVLNQPFSAFSAYFAGEMRQMRRIYNFHSSWFEEFEVKKYINDIKLDSLSNILRLIIFKPVSFIMRGIEGFIVTHCDKVVVASEYSKTRLLEFYKVDNQRIYIIPGCVDTEKFKPAEDKSALRDKLGILPQKYVLITARNLVERMGIENLILAFYNLSKQYKDLYLTIVGEGRLKHKLVAMVKGLGIVDLVIFTGKLVCLELIKYYQASDLFILPTKYIEHFGLVTLEALASGVPVLGTPVGGTVEILNKFNNEFIFKGTDVNSIEQGIKNFLDKYKGLDLKEKCREFVIREYPLDKIIGQTEKLYLDTIKE